MRVFRIFVVALVLLSLQGYVASAVGHAPAKGDSMMAGMDGHSMDDCCPGGHDTPSPCDSTQKDGLCGACQLGHTCKASQVFMLRVAIATVSLPLAYDILSVGRAEIPLQPPDLLLRPPRLV